MKIIRYYSMGKGKVADESAGTLFQDSATRGQGSCHTAVIRRGFSPRRTEYGHRSVQEISDGECGKEAGFSHSTCVLPCQFSLLYCFTFIYHERRTIGPLHAAGKRQSHSKNKTKCNGNVIESSVTRVVRKAHLTYTVDI